MASVLKRLHRRTDPDDLREALFHDLAARVQAHRTRQLGDDDKVSAVLLDLAAFLALGAKPPTSERDFSVAAINAYVEAKRQHEGTDDEAWEGERDEEEPE